MPLESEAFSQSTSRHRKPWLPSGIHHLREVLERAKPRSPLGLISEDVDPRTGRQWGNFPQAYSHVGLIRAAFAASPGWHEVL